MFNQTIISPRMVDRCSVGTGDRQKCGAVRSIVEFRGTLRCQVQEFGTYALKRQDLK